MKQVTYNRYGTSNVLNVEKSKKPLIKNKKSLLVKVQYSSLNAIDWKNRKGDFRLVSGILKPRTKQGFDVVGIVENKSNDIKEFNIGDKIAVLLGNFKGGACSEYVIANSENAVKIPTELSTKAVAGIPMAGTTAWLALLKLGKLEKGNKVLINGGSSGVGHLAIQIAKAYGAKVTSISSTKNKEFCKQLGSDNTISYEEDDFLNIRTKFDIVFDVVFNQSYKKTKHLLAREGKYIGTTPTLTMIYELLRYKNAKFVAVHPNKEALGDMLRLMQSKQLSVNIDKEFLLNEIVDAHNYIEKSKTVGKLIINVK